MWFKKAFIAMIALVLGAFIVVPKTKVARDRVYAYLVPLYERSFDCSVSCDTFSFSLLFPTMELSGVKIIPRDKAVLWSLKSEKVILSASWFGIITRGIFNLSVTLEHPTIFSEANGQQVSFIKDHVQRYFEGTSSLPITLKALMLRHVAMRIRDQKHDLEVHSVFSCDYKKMKSGYGFNVHCEDVTVRYGSAVCAHTGKGYWQSFFEESAGTTTLTGNGQGEITLFQGEHAELCYWDAKAAQEGTKIIFWHSDSSDDQGTITVHDRAVDATLTMTLARIADHVVPLAYAHMIKGMLKGAYHGSLDDGLEKGTLLLTVNDGAYGNHEIFKEVIFSVPPFSDGMYRGDVALKLTDKEALSGIWSWEPKTKKGSARLVNAAGIELGSFLLAPDPANKGGYVASTVLHVPSDEPDKESSLLVKAEGRYAKGALSLHAERGEEKFFLEGTLGDTFDVSLLRWIDGNQKTLIDLSYDSAEKHRITGLIDIGAVQRLAKQVWGISLHGEGAVEVRGRYENKRYELALEGSKLAVRLPRIYNVINGLAGKIIFDPQTSTLDLTDVRCTLHRGSFSIPHAQVHYDPLQEIIVYDIPLSLTSFWFNVEKDLYALFSGELTLRRTDATTPLLAGELMVERAHVSESLLKIPALQKTHPQSVFEEAHLYPLGLAITVRSKNPIQVTLARLEGLAHIAIQVGNTLADPTLSGIVRLESGKVVFPYKPLMIRKAQIIFTPQQSYDPTIELFAKSRIKGFDVSLSIQGTLSSHDIQMQSTPPLSDEQLIGLLYAGSEQGAFGLVPSMVMRNISSIFSKNGSDAATSSADKNSWRERLKRVHIVPSFTDQRGRGGVRGTLEVDINDRWRALMQRNFFQAEDTRFELDYDLSDDVSFRALRDERRDLGAEVEVKMKF